MALTSNRPPDHGHLNPRHPDPPPTPEQKKTGEEMASFYEDLCSKYPIISIEVRSIAGF